MQQAKKESFVSKLVIVLCSWALGSVATGLAAGCAFAPTGDAARDQARVIAASKNVDVAEEVKKAQDAKDAAEHTDASKD